MTRHVKASECKAKFLSVIEEVARTGQTIVVTKRGKPLVDVVPHHKRREALAAGVEEIPLTGEIAILARGLENLHGDPIDRFIVATGIVHDATLMTADRKLLNWRHELKRQNARK